MKRPAHPIHSRYFCPLALGVMLTAGLTVPTYAATKTWDGGGADNFWKTGLNWNANTAPVAGDALIFTGPARLNNTNDFIAGTGFAGINFLSPAGAFALGGCCHFIGRQYHQQPVARD